jgi:hypothetical protein
VNIRYSVQRDRVWSPGKIRSIPKFHGLVWKFGQSQPQPVYCPPYWEIAACRRIARPDPYHRNDTIKPKRTTSLWIGIVALIAGWLTLASGAYIPGHGGGHVKAAPVIHHRPAIHAQHRAKPHPRHRAQHHPKRHGQS